MLLLKYRFKVSGQACTLRIELTQQFTIHVYAIVTVLIATQRDIGAERLDDCDTSLVRVKYRIHFQVDLVLLICRCDHRA